ncbi:hypothetical protein [Paenibacillus xylanilyticus]|uniref:hypothetical protein n=1 Tax=Paenibacillus xylanilyticus TaxID=248903 RepID=UPI0039A1152C
MIKIPEDKIRSVKDKHLSYFESTGLPLLKDLAVKPSRLKKERKVWEYLLKEYKTVILGEPEQLETVITEVNRINGGRSLSKAISRGMMTVFDYGKFSVRQPGVHDNNWGAYLLVKELNISVCPYCNRQYIHAYRMKSKSKDRKAQSENYKEGQTRAVLDHFYDKANFPYLSLSLYNLIPCCKVCNSDFKGTKSFTLNSFLHPYQDGFEDKVRFTINPPRINGTDEIDLTELLQKKELEIGIRFMTNDSDFKQRVENSVNLFKIKELYNFHDDYITEIIQKSYHYSSEAIDNLLDNSGLIFQTREEVARFVVGNYVFNDGHHKRTLSKLTEDIVEELGLLQRFKDIRL